MISQENIYPAIYRAVDSLNLDLPADRQIAKTPETRLYGPESRMDSLLLVGLIVAVEREIEDEFGVGLTLADDRALSMKQSPFRTLATLSEHVAMCIKEAGNV